MRDLGKKTTVIVKKPVRQKIIVEQGRQFSAPVVPYKVLYTEVVASKEDADKRVAELREEYKDVDALSIHYFSL